MSHVSFRNYRAGDWAAMYALDLICFEPPFRYSRQAMRRFAEAENAVVVLAESDGGLAGFCVAHAEAEVMYIVTLDVLPESRRSGLGARLMADMEARARTAGAQSVALHVFTGNQDAIRFYQALGYELLGPAKDFYGRGIDAFLYMKHLVEPRQNQP